MSDVTYQVETMAASMQEMSLLLVEHWHEVALDHAAIPLAPMFSHYREIEATGELHLLTARRGGALIGYAVGFVRPHLHYGQTLHAFTDLYFITKAERRGLVGVRLFREYERTLRERGVVKVIAGTKVAHDMSVIFERLGWRETEKLFTKVIGGQ